MENARCEESRRGVIKIIRYQSIITLDKNARIKEWIEMKCVSKDEHGLLNVRGLNFLFDFSPNLSYFIFVVRFLNNDR